MGGRRMTTGPAMNGVMATAGDGHEDELVDCVDVGEDCSDDMDALDRMDGTDDAEVEAEVEDEGCGSPISESQAEDEAEAAVAAVATVATDVTVAMERVDWRRSSRDGLRCGTRMGSSACTVSSYRRAMSGDRRLLGSPMLWTLPDRWGNMLLVCLWVV